MNDSLTSPENSRKLDRIIQLIEGEKDAPGILGKLAIHEEVLFGKKGSSGLVSKVGMMWRAHVWILCTMSGVGGYWLKELVNKIHP